jgi:hypothetical protein
MKSKIAFVLLAFFFIFSCKTVKNINHFECKGLSEQGFILVSIENKNKYSLDDIYKSALDQVLTKGFASQNCQTQYSIIPATDLVKFNKISKKFYANNGDWKTFITPISDYAKNENHQNVSFKINKNALQSYLQNKGILKPLNNIF